MSSHDLELRWPLDGVRRHQPGPLSDGLTDRAGATAEGVWRRPGVFQGAQGPWRLAEQNAAAVRGKTRVRQVIGDRDETLGFNRDSHDHQTKLEIPHTFTVLPGIPHNPMAVLNALGEANWDFYRAVFGKELNPPSSASVPACTPGGGLA